MDAAPEYKELAFEKVLPNNLLTANREYYSNPILNSEKIDKIKSYKQVDKHKCVFKIPLTVITRGLPDNYEEGWSNQKILEVEQRLQFEFKKLSIDSRIIVAQNLTKYLMDSHFMLCIIVKIKVKVNLVKRTEDNLLNNLFLIEPNKGYKYSFEDYVSTYRRINDNQYFNIYKKALENFSDYLNDTYNYSNGINLPQGKATTSTFWLINKRKVVGVIKIRHQEVECAGHIGYDISPDYRNMGYGSEILKLALERTENIEIKEVVLTCNIGNIASKKIIEKHGGKLMGTVFDEEEDEYLYKFIITSTNI